MTRKQLLEAISHLEYLVLNHPDPARADAFAQELQQYRDRLRALETNRGSSSSSTAGPPK